MRNLFARIFPPVLLMVLATAVLPLRAESRSVDVNVRSKQAAKTNPAKRTNPKTLKLTQGDALLKELGIDQEEQPDAKEAAVPPTATPQEKEEDFLSKEELFGSPASPAEQQTQKQAPAPRIKWNGFVQEEIARTYASPEHWSKVQTRAQLVGQGRFNDKVKWKISARLDYNAIYALTDYYPDAVRDDQELNFFLRENYLDVSAGDWDFRLGRQHIVWGEMVGVFVADVVSAKDMREFILPDFEILRIPQWAARAEYFKNDFHAELIWIPYASVDKIGVPGSDFFQFPPPPPPGFGFQVLGEQRPASQMSDGNYGVRLSSIKKGWDLSGFFYNSIDASPTFYRQIITAPAPAFVYEPRHNRIWQTGATLAKDFGSKVLKAEAVYTHGRQFNVTTLSDDDGLVDQDTLDYIVGLDFTLPKDIRLNLQAFQRVYFDHDPDIIPDEFETAVSIFISGRIGSRWEPELLVIQSLNRNEGMIRPRVNWNFKKNWKLSVGLDIFHGPSLGLFGQFDQRDRAYAEVRYSF